MTSRAVKVVTPRTREERIALYVGALIEVVGWLLTLGAAITLGAGVIGVLMALALVLFGRSLRRR